MIRRVPHGQLLESITPRQVTGGAPLRPPAPLPLAEDPSSVDELNAQAFRQGYGEGFEAGEQDGRREAEQFQQAWEAQTRLRMEEELQTLVHEREAIAALAAGLQQQLQSQQEEMEHLAFELALQSLAQMFGEMQGDGEALRRLCQHLAETYRGKATRLEVSVSDRVYLPDHLEGLEIAVEHALAPGECRIVSARGYAQSSIAMRMQAIYQAMLEAVGVVRT